MSKDSESMEKLVAKREKEKAKKPKFVRQESWRYKRLKENWRRPRGIDNKIRRKVKGWPAAPNVGYRGPKKARGLHPSAFKEVRVFNPDDLSKVDPETEAIRIASCVGGRKRAEIIREARERGIHILNPGAIEEASTEEGM
ncbi:50S ribosomal protein L32e [Candidatus Bathyarchaeota archaeon]|nr:50S ribosomal protein L32e [Candidatus Bathyarchaeota archaeon]